MKQLFENSGQFPVRVPLVTPHMVQARTLELAINAGRRSHEIKQSDYERAKRELTGETDSARQQAVLYPKRYCAGVS